MRSTCNSAFGPLEQPAAKSLAIYVTLAVLFEVFAQRASIKLGQDIGHLIGLRHGACNDLFFVELRTAAGCKNVLVTTKKPPTVTRTELLGFLTLPSGGQKTTFIDHEGVEHTGIVLGVERYDASGWKFNVKLLAAGVDGPKTVFVQCSE